MRDLGCVALPIDPIHSHDNDIMVTEFTIDARKSVRIGIVCMTIGRPLVVVIARPRPTICSGQKTRLTGMAKFDPP